MGAFNSPSPVEDRYDDNKQEEQESEELGSPKYDEVGGKEGDITEEVEKSIAPNFEGGCGGQVGLNAKYGRRWTRVKDHRMITDEDPTGVFQGRKRKGSAENGEENGEKKARILSTANEGAGLPKALSDQ